MLASSFLRVSPFHNPNASHQFYSAKIFHIPILPELIRTMALISSETLFEGFTTKTLLRATAENRALVSRLAAGSRKHSEAVRESERLQAAISRRLDWITGKLVESDFETIYLQDNTHDQAPSEAEIDHSSALAVHHQVDHHDHRDYGSDTAAAEYRPYWGTQEYVPQEPATGLEQPDHEHEVGQADAGSWGDNIVWDAPYGECGDSWGVEAVPNKAPNLLARLLGKDSMPTMGKSVFYKIQCMY